MPQHISIPRDDQTLAADLYRPDADVPPGGLPAVVLSTPGSSVKGQIGANYAARLARRGYVALVFDPLHQGESSGEPRDREDPYRRSEDVSYAVDELLRTPGVDPRRIGLLGICAGGGYGVFAARTDHRIAAVGTVVATDMGRAWRSPAMAPEGAAAALDDLAADRTREVVEGVDARVAWLPDTPAEAQAAGLTDRDTTEAVTYYRTPRGHDEHSTNRRLRRSDSLLIGFDAFHLVEQLLTQPLQVVVAGRPGGVTGQYEAGRELYDRAPNAVDLMVVEGAGHYEMYDEPRYVDQAVERLAAFYDTHL
ncbi:alpha/beta hydrolase [Nocardioides sp. C4-1]|uniref:alpha/beta hydrolase n=1 Tax=Nocardioides sp. C4-1 TaxID=3151851 RepID=UPI00326385FE